MLVVGGDQALGNRHRSAGRLYGESAVQRLFEVFVVAQLDRPWGKPLGLGHLFGQDDRQAACLLDEEAQIVCAVELTSGVDNRCLQRLLDGLLSVKADDRVGDSGELVERYKRVEIIA